MPNIIIREIDNTEAEEVVYDDYVVLVPGLDTFVDSKITEKLFDSVETFKTEVTPYLSTVTAKNYEIFNAETNQWLAITSDEPADPVEGQYWDDITADKLKVFTSGEWVDYSGEIVETKENPVDGAVYCNEVSESISYSYEIVKVLLEQGLKVLFVSVNNYNVLTSDAFWTPYTDKGKYNLRFLTTGGYPIPGVAAAQCMIKCAATRGDAIALVNPTGATTTADLLEFVNQLVVAPIVRPADTATGTTIEENPFKYAAAFGPSFKFKGTTFKFPGYVGYLACFAKHTKKFADWFAMAGATRGVMPFEQVTPEFELGDNDIALLQKRSNTGDDAYKAVNPICEIRPYGHIIWGNRTLFPIGSATATGLVASSFLNIRNLCCDIKKTLYRAARRYTFDPDSGTLWTNFVNAIKPLLEQMKSGQGIRGYRIIKQASKQKATLKAKIQIIPIEAVEDFDLTVELTDSISVTEE